MVYMPDAANHMPFDLDLVSGSYMVKAKSWSGSRKHMLPAFVSCVAAGIAA